VSIILGEWSPPRYFGFHPGLKYAEKRFLSQARRQGIKPSTDEYYGKKVSLSEFFDERHPSVYVIPSDRFIRVVDQWGDLIGIEEIGLPFSSTNFFIDRWDDKWVFEELKSTPFWRLGDISQLGYLVPPHPETTPHLKVSFCPPLFTHTRWIHCLIAAALGEVILARNGFPKEERAPIVLAIAYHDIAIPAGGESGKRVDLKELHEENNFSWILKRYGLAKRWEDRFGFNLEEASLWVKNKGVFGQLLDIVDRMSYTSLDCYHLGCYINGQVRQYCIENPLFMDAWQDIRFTDDKKRFAFINPERLFSFLVARAYEHRELLLNPHARVLDFFLTKLIRPLYKRGIITKKNLLTWGTSRLQEELSKYYLGEKVKPTTVSPGEYGWNRSQTESGIKRFCRFVGGIDHIEHITGFNSGLDWPVFADNQRIKIVPLKKRLGQNQIDFLEKIIGSVKGWYAYWHNNP